MRAAVSAVGLIIGLALIIVNFEVAARGQFVDRSLAAGQPGWTGNGAGVKTHFTTSIRRDAQRKATEWTAGM
jgi:hypothetical protein